MCPYYDPADWFCCVTGDEVSLDEEDDFCENENYVNCPIYN